MRFRQAKHKSTRNDLDLTQHELNREKSRNVDLQNSVATARGSENSAVKRCGESLATLADARLAVKAKDEDKKSADQKRILRYVPHFFDVSRSGSCFFLSIDSGFAKFK